MRLSNGVARLETLLARTARRVRHTASDAAFALKCKRENFRLAVLAQQQAELDRKLKALSPVDLNEVEVRALDIAAIQDAAAIRKQEMQLRARYAQAVKNGEISLFALSTLLEQPKE